MGHNDNRFSRRQIVSGLGVGFAATVVRSTFIENTSQPSVSPPLQDPTVKYPKPPFKAQSQPWPGLASKMDPRPDHGETSYRGSGRLAGRKALITGDDSGMGRAAAIAYAREGSESPSTICPPKSPTQAKSSALSKKKVVFASQFPAICERKPFASDWYLKRFKVWAGSISSSVMRADSRPMTPSLTFPPSNSTGR